QPPPAFGVLSTATITWQSDEAGDYVVELGGTGTIGSGTTLSSGTVAAGVPMGQPIKGLDLSFSAAKSLWVHVTDALSHEARASLNRAMKPPEAVPLGGEVHGIAINPAGTRAYVARNGDDRVAVIDVNPASGTYHTVLDNVVVGDGPHGVAVTPDGSRVYVTNNGGTPISVIAAATNTAVATPGAARNTNTMAIT